jgi:phosphoserine phosphatase
LSVILESDLPIFDLVERAICFNPTSGLYKQAKKRGWEVVLERKDLILSVKNGKVI